MIHVVRITRANGEVLEHRLTKAQTTVGSDPRSDICLHGETGVLPQHVLLAPRDGECWISTTAGSPLWDEQGQAVEGAFVPWGARLTLGNCVFELQNEEKSKNPKKSRNRRGGALDKGGESTEAKSQGVHPGFLMLLIATLAYAAFGFAGAANVHGATLPPAPSLFAEDAAACESDSPGHRAAALEEQAIAKSERSVFDLQDGVAAVGLYAQSHACYVKAGRAEEAEYVLESGKNLRRDMEEEYALLRLRLSRQISASETERALVQVRRLSQLLRHQSQGKYWLALRRLSSRLTAEGTKL